MNPIIMAYFDYESQKLHYIAKGEGDLLVILPGNTSSGMAHQGQVDYFSNHFFTIAPDFLGTGNSERLASWPDNWYEYAARQISALISHLGYQKAYVMGTSGGAVVAVHLAALYPEKMEALVLDSFSSRFSVEMLEENVLAKRSKPGEMQMQFWQFCHGEDWEDVVEKDTIMLKNLVENGGNWLKNRHRSIKCPVLLMASKQDTMLPEVEKDYLKLIMEFPDARITLSHHGAHPLMWTNSSFYNREAMQFLTAVNKK